MKNKKITTYIITMLIIISVSTPVFSAVMIDSNNVTYFMVTEPELDAVRNGSILGNNVYVNYPIDANSPELKEYDTFMYRGTNCEGINLDINEEISFVISHKDQISKYEEILLSLDENSTNLIYNFSEEDFKRFDIVSIVKYDYDNCCYSFDKLDMNEEESCLNLNKISTYLHWMDYEWQEGIRLMITGIPHISVIYVLLPKNQVEHKENMNIEYNLLSDLTVSDLFYELPDLSDKLPVELATPTPTKKSTHSGDLDNNKRVNAQDALIVLKHAAKLQLLSDRYLLEADMNQDNCVDAADALIILKKAAKIID